MGGRRWTEEEERFLRDNYRDMTYKEIGEYLNRKTESVTVKIGKMNLTKIIKWAQDEEDFIRENYLNMTYKEISKRLNKEEQSVRNKIRKMKLTKIAKWSKEEEDFVRENYLNMEYDEIGKRLNRDITSVTAKIRSMNLNKITKWSKEDEKFLRENYLNLSHKEISKHLGKTVGSIGTKISRMGLIKTPQEKHGLTSHPLYTVWIYIRMTSKKLNFEFPDYWVSFSEFYEWAISNGWKEGLNFVRKNEQLPFNKENCEFISKSEFTKRNRPKMQKTNLEKYGYEHAIQNKSIKEKQEQTCLERFGFRTSLKNDKIKEKTKQTNLKKYNTKYPTQNKDVKQKAYDSRVKSGHIKIFEGKTIRQWSEELNKPYTTFHQRRKKHGFKKAIGMKEYQTDIEGIIANLLDNNDIKYETRQTVCKLKPDFLINPNLIIEADRIYYHSDAYKDKYYHFNKQQTYLDNGYTSLFFREDEINEKLKIVESIILNKLNRSKRIFARKCIVKEIDRKKSKEFLETNHLMGNGQGRSFVLIYDNEIISLMRVKKKKDWLEISRFCHKLNYSVIGGFSKLLSYIIKTLNPKSISTFIDERYGDGKYLLDMGFNKINCDLSFKWGYQHKTFHRMKFPGNSGYEHGYFKIWDCGQTKWVKKIRNS